MSDTIIQVDNISKMYRLGTIGSGTLATDLNRFIARMRGKEDPTQKIGTNDRTTKADNEFVWSLKDINFEIKQGDAVGIIGRNGAGKSTLLKILSRVTAPTTGSIKIKGRVASLLEVGTGFHPELSGRDNIYMNGAILGMSRGEIRSKFDEIVDFAGVEKYIDTPVKRYSSGMYVRLAFAVAAHLEPDILIIDEVLAVGDAEFQKKCLGKMQDVNSKDGRTVLFVSHNMGAVKNLCTKGIYLSNGNLQYTGTSDGAIERYLKGVAIESSVVLEQSFVNTDNMPMFIQSAKLLKNNNYAADVVYDFNDSLGLELEIVCTENIQNRGINIHIHDMFDHLLSAFDISVLPEYLENREIGTHLLRVNFPKPIFKQGSYSIDLEVGWFGVGAQQVEKSVFKFDVDIISRNPRFEAATQNRMGRVYVEPTWEYIK